MMLKNCSVGRDLFNKFWVASILLLPIYIEKGALDSRVYKDFLFLKITLISLILFKSTSTALGKLCSVLLVVSMIKYPSYGSAGVFQTIYFAAGVALINQFVANWNEDTSRKILNAIALAGVVQATYLYINFLGYDVYELVFQSKRVIVDPGARNLKYFPLIGSLDHWMVSGMHLSMCIPAMFRGKWSLLLPYVLGTYLFTDSALSTASLLITGMVWLLFNRPKIGYIVGPAGVISAYLLRNSDYFTPGDRVRIWGKTIEFVKSSMFGNGLGYYKDHFSKFFPADERFIHPHNEILNIYAIGGLLAIAVLVWLMWMCWKYWRREPHFFFILVSFSVSSMAGFPLFISSTALIFIVSIASLLRFNHNNPNN